MNRWQFRLCLSILLSCLSGVVCLSGFLIVYLYVCAVVWPPACLSARVSVYISIYLAVLVTLNPP